MHSHGRALNGLRPRAVDDVDAYDVREGELVAGVVLGYNFGDGHFHDHRLLAAVQERCRFEPGELRVVTLESQPAHVQRQRYRIYDAADGLVEEGWVDVADMVGRQPWLGGEPVPGPRSGHACPYPRHERARSSSAPAPTGWPARRPWPAAASAVTVIEAAETIGGGTRSSELTVPGLLHDDCSAPRHPMVVASPALALARTRAPRARVGLARGRPRPPARRRRGGGDAALDRGDRGRARRGGRAPGGASSAPSAERLRRAQRGLLPAAAPPAAPPAAAGPLRPAGGDAGDDAGRVAAARREARGAVRRHRRPRLRAAQPAVQLGGRDGADLLRPPPTAGRWRGAARSRSPTPGPRWSASTAARSRPAAGCARSTSCPTADAVVLDLAPRGVAGARRRPAAGPGRPRLPPLQARAGRLQARPRGRGRGALDPGGGAAGGDRARDRLLRGVGRGRARGQPRPDAGAALRPRRPAVPRRPGALERRPAPGLGLRPRPQRLRGRRDARRSSTSSSASPPAPRERIVASTTRTPAELEATNANYVGGDILTGANTPLQTLLRPRITAGSLLRPASPASSSARRRPRPAPAPTASAATTPPKQRFGPSKN